jgi:AcrR family transcriptional regulator
MAARKSSARRASKGRAPERRSEEARVAVLEAAVGLLVEQGYGAVTVEGIATRAGVGKQTIYRWWPSKVEVLLDVLDEEAERRLRIPEDGPVPAAVRAYLHALARFLAQTEAGEVLLALLGEAQHDAEVAALFHERYLDPRRARERALLRRGVAAGELPAKMNLDATLDALIGPLVFRALTGAALSRGFVDSLADRALTPPR